MSSTSFVASIPGLGSSRGIEPGWPCSAAWEAWLEEHASSLHQLAHDGGLAIGLVYTAAALVFMGADDDEIYDQLRAQVISLDGQQSPLAGAPHVVHEIRRLVAVTTEEGE